MTPDLVYGRRSVHEALRGRREVLEVWATERAVKAEPWLAEAQPRLKLDRELSERAAYLTGTVIPLDGGMLRSV